MRSLVPEDLVGQFFAVGSLSESDPTVAKEYVQSLALPYAFQLPVHPEEDMIRQIGSLIEGYEETDQFVLDLDVYTFRDVTEEDEPLFFDREHARGLYEMMDGRDYRFFKTQQTAPATMCFSVRDSEGEQLVSKQMFHFFARLLLRLAQGQIDFLAKHCGEVILSQDDPALGFLIRLLETREDADLTPWQIVKGTDEVFPDKAVASYHCCDDWRILEYDDKYLLWEGLPKIMHIDLLTYPVNIDERQAEAINAFMKRGGGMALGVLPNIDDGYSDSVTSTLEHNLKQTVSAFNNVGVDMELLRTQSMVSTQCGLSHASQALARRIHIESESFPLIFQGVFDELS